VSPWRWLPAQHRPHDARARTNYPGKGRIIHGVSNAVQGLPPPLVACFEACFEEGRAAWPGISIELGEFVRRLRQLEVAEDDLVKRPAELTLAFACAGGDAVAIRYFDAAFMPAVSHHVGRFNLPADTVDDIRQRVRMKQLVGTAPGISRYRGRGPLGAWVRVAAVRVALDVIAESDPPALSLDIDVPELWSALNEGPEVETLKKLYRDRLVTGLEESLRLLEPRERTLLRLHIVDNLGIDSIARIYKVHRATVARQLIAVRRRIFDLLREKLAIRFGISTAELRSVAKVLQSEIHISAQRILA
jgi:RNA polymerase sigma-70 factor (ECF subfamily)